MLSMLPRGPSGVRQLREMFVEARAQRLTLGAVRPGARQHDEIPRRELTVVTKRFARETFELVAVHGPSRSATRDRQAEPSSRPATRSRKHGEIPIARTRRLGEDSPELGRPMQSLVGRKPCRVGEQRRAKTGPVRASGERGPLRAGSRELFARRSWPCGRGNHACAYGADC